MLFLDMGFYIAFTAVNTKEIDWTYALVMIPFTIVARTVGTIVQTFFLNFRRQKIGEKLTWRDQIVLIFCGLRGGIAFALSLLWELPAAKSSQVVFATGVLVLFTIVVYGISMKPVL